MKYTPTESDRLTGIRVRQLRKQHGETQADTCARSGVGFGYASLSRVEEGKRHLTIPEATKLAAYFNTTVDKIIIKAPAVETEQAWLGNQSATSEHWLGNPSPALFAVPERDEPATTLPFSAERSIIIDRDNPLTPEQYREQVWIPYLETRYSADLKAS